MRFLPRLLLCLVMATATIADFAGSSGDGFSITYPTAGLSFNRGQIITITWTKSNILPPRVRVLPITNGAPDEGNAVTLDGFTTDTSYSWTITQTFSPAVVSVGLLLGNNAYSPQFNILTVPPPNSTTISSSSAVINATSKAPNSTMVTKTTLPTTTQSNSTMMTSVSSISSSVSDSNVTIPDNVGTRTSQDSLPATLVVGGIVAAIVAVAGVIYVALRKTRRRRRPVSMPLIVEDTNETQEWTPPEWTQHNQVPSYRKPQYGGSMGYASGAGYAGSGSLGYSSTSPYYSDATPMYASPPAMNMAGAPDMAGVPTATIIPAMAMANVPSASDAPVVVPEEAHIREKTAVLGPDIVLGKEEMEDSSEGAVGAGKRGSEASARSSGTYKPHAT